MQLEWVFTKFAQGGCVPLIVCNKRLSCTEQNMLILLHVCNCRRHQAEVIRGFDCCACHSKTRRAVQAMRIPQQVGSSFCLNVTVLGHTRKLSPSLGVGWDTLSVVAEQSQASRCTGKNRRKQTDCQRWLIKHGIARSKTIEAWLDIPTPRPTRDHADVLAEVGRLRQAE